MREAMLRCREAGSIIAAHCEDVRLIPKGGAIHDGAYAASHGHAGICSESEWRQIERDIRAVNAGSRSMRVWHACGDQDVLRENALKTRDFFEALPQGAIDYSFATLPGRHDWALWDAMLAKFMLLLPAAEGRFM